MHSSKAGILLLEDFSHIAAAPAIRRYCPSSSLEGRLNAVFSEMQGAHGLCMKSAGGLLRRRRLHWSALGAGPSSREVSKTHIGLTQREGHCWLMMARLPAAANSIKVTKTSLRLACCCGCAIAAQKPCGHTRG